MHYMTIQIFFQTSKKHRRQQRVEEVIANGILIKELNESYYAVAIYHDENSNKNLILSFNTKGNYGFSNNAVFFGPPNLKMQDFC